MGLYKFDIGDIAYFYGKNPCEVVGRHREGLHIVYEVKFPDELDTHYYPSYKLHKKPE